MKALIAFSDCAGMEALCEAMAETDMDLELCSTLADVRVRLAQTDFALVFCEARLPDGNFRDLLRFAGSRGVKVVVCSKSNSQSACVEALSLGAFDIVVSPYRKSDVEGVVENALRDATSHKLVSKNPWVASRVGRSSSTQRLAP